MCLIISNNIIGPLNAFVPNLFIYINIYCVYTYMCVVCICAIYTLSMFFMHVCLYISVHI